VSREQKLALVLGFAAVLVVGLLLSDHFAAANAQRLDAAPDDSSVVIETHSRDRRLTQAVPIPQDQPATHATPPAPAQPDSGEATGATSAARTDTRAASTPRPAYLVLGEGGGVRTPNANNPSGAGGGSLIERAGRAVAGGMERLADSVRDAADAAGSARVDPLAARGGPIAHRLPDAAAEERVVQHHVREGETLYEIAQHYYGKGTLWRRIARDNPGRVGEDGLVRKGVLLRIHEPTRATTTPAADGEPPPQGARTYAVRPNDTLGEIAQRQLGTVRRQDELLELNRRLIDDPDELRPGMVLRLPTP